MCVFYRHISLRSAEKSAVIGVIKMGAIKLSYFHRKIYFCLNSLHNISVYYNCKLKN